MSNKRKNSSRTQAPQNSSKAQATDANQPSLSSLADLRPLYDVLKAESILARQVAAVTGKDQTQQAQQLQQPLSQASSAHTTNKASAFVAPKEINWLSTLQTSTRLAVARPQKMTFDQRISDHYEPVLSHYKDGAAYFCKPGVGPDIARKLWQRKLDIQAQIDLHGLRLDEAREVITEFVEDAVQEGVRCIRVIHGKGFGSTNQQPALKGKVYTWLAQLNETLAFCEARPNEGGAGAVIVLLRSARRAGY